RPHDLDARPPPLAREDRERQAGDERLAAAIAAGQRALERDDRPAPPEHLDRRRQVERGRQRPRAELDRRRRFHARDPRERRMVALRVRLPFTAAIRPRTMAAPRRSRRMSLPPLLLVPVATAALLAMRGGVDEGGEWLVKSKEA